MGKYLNKIVHANCQDVFEDIKREENISLILSDPPYSIGFDKYDEYDDNLTEEEYIELIKTFRGDIPVAMCQYPEEMMKYICPALGNEPDEVLCWLYNSNLNKQFRLVNIYGKKPDFTKCNGEYQNPTDKRIKQRIEAGLKPKSYDWGYLNLVKNVTKGNISHPCPVPAGLMEWIILMLTDKGDTVYDPFMGGGTTMEACLNTSRNYIGTELSEQYIKLCEQRKILWEQKNPVKVF